MQNDMMTDLDETGDSPRKPVTLRPSRSIELYQPPHATAHTSQQQADNHQIETRCYNIHNRSAVRPDGQPDPDE
jgi:hypothetical protein